MAQIYKWKEKRILTSVTKFNSNLATCFSTSLSTYCCRCAGSGSLCKERFLLRCWSKWLPYLSFRSMITESTVPMNRTPKRGNIAFWPTLGNAVFSSVGGCMNVLLQIRRNIPDCLTERNLKKKVKILRADCQVAESRDCKLLAFTKRWKLIGYLQNCMTEYLTR